LEFYGKLWWVKAVHCVPAEASGEALRDEVLAALAAARRRGSLRVAVAAVIVNHLFANARPRGLGEYWADDPQEGQQGFRQLLAHLVPAAHVQVCSRMLAYAGVCWRMLAYAMRVLGYADADACWRPCCGSVHEQAQVDWLLEHALERRQFVAAHWRRGDRGHPEMGIASLSM
jgi:hypothetical protein